MRKTIKILPINIPKQDAPILLEVVDTDLFQFKAKKKVAEFLKGINQDEFVFYQNNRNLVVHEEDRVSKIFQIKEQYEIELYLTSDLIKNFNEGGDGQQMKGQQQNNRIKIESEINSLKKEIQNLQNTIQQQQIQYDNLIRDHQNKVNELKNQQQSMKQHNENQLKYYENLRVEIINKYKDVIATNQQLKNQLMQKDQIIEDLNDQLKMLEAEKQYLEEQHKKQNYGKETNTNDKQIAEIRFEFEKLKRLYQEGQFEIKKNKEIIQELKEQKEKQKNEIKQNIDEISVKRNQYLFEISNFNYKIKQTEERSRKYKDLTISQTKEISDLKNKCSYLKQQNIEIEAELNFTKMKITNLEKSLKEQLEELEKRNGIINEIKNSKNFQETLKSIADKEVDNLKNTLQIKNNELKKLEQEDAKKTVYIQTLEKQLEYEISIKNQTVEKLQQQIDNLLDQLNQKDKMMDSEKIKKDQIIKRIKDNTIRKLRYEKIISPTEALLRNIDKPHKFQKNEGIMTKQYFADVEIINVDKNKAIESLTKLHDPDLIKFVNKKPVGKWEIQQSIAYNGEGTKRKGFLMKVLNSDDGLYNKQTFLIKELDGYERNISIEKALYVAQNTLIAKVLAEHFQEKIKVDPTIIPCKFQYNEPFLLNCDGQYYIAERLVEGNFIQFNEEDFSKTEATYFYAFQMFTYQVTQQMLMVSNIQGHFNGSEYLLCDPVISSPEGIMGDEDLAEPHILKILDYYKRNPKQCGEDFLSKLGSVIEK